jgi:hypothetical protein
VSVKIIFPFGLTSIVLNLLSSALTVSLEMRIHDPIIWYLMLLVAELCHGELLGRLIPSMANAANGSAKWFFISFPPVAQRLKWGLIRTGRQQLCQLRYPEGSALFSGALQMIRSR